MKKSKVAVISSRVWQIIEMIAGCFLVGLFGLVTIVSIGDETFTSDMKTICIILIALGAILIYKSVKRAKLIKDFKKYVQILAGDPCNSLDTIAEATGSSYDAVEKNVAKMIKKHYFANAWINDNTRSLVIGGRQYPGKSYSSAPLSASGATQAHTAPDREMLSVICSGCGAVNLVGRGQVVECEYCGNMIKGE